MSKKENQDKRYDRNIRVEWIGEEGQKKLSASKVLVIGAGGLGSPCILYLAAAGIGRIGICEFDIIDPSNLNRQILHYSKNIGKSKAESAKERVLKLNPYIEVVLHKEKLEQNNASSIIKEYDFVIDASDNFKTKFIINDVCVRNKRAFSHAGALGAGGQAMTYVPGNACLRCLLKEQPDKYPTSLDEGILGAAAGTLGTIQAAEAIKYITGKGILLTDRVLIYDALNMKFRELNISRRRGCICEKQS